MGAAMSLFNNVSADTLKAIKEQAPRLLSNSAERFLPAGLRDVASEIVQLYESGWANDAIKQAGVRALLKAGQFTAVRELFLNTANPLLGGVTPLTAIDKIGRGGRRAQGNLFIVSLTPLDASVADTPAFNVFATSVEYSPFTVTGEYQRIGGVLIDTITGNEAVELSMVTLDDAAGSIKRWFAQMSARIAAGDGTIGVPASYAIRIDVTHAFADSSDIPPEAYRDSGLFRCANLSTSLTRGENNLAELQLTFTQVDTFWS